MKRQILTVKASEEAQILKVLYIVTIYSKYTRALTFENTVKASEKPQILQPPPARNLTYVILHT